MVERFAQIEPTLIFACDGYRFGGKDFDDLRYRRDMQRATVSDIANTCEQAGVAVAAE